MGEDEAYRLYHLGIDAIQRGEHHLAERCFLESLDHAPHAKTFHELSKLCARGGRHDEALKYLRAAYDENPRSDRVCVDLATCLLALGEKTEALDLVDSVLGRNKSYGPARSLRNRITSNKPSEIDKS